MSASAVKNTVFTFCFLVFVVGIQGSYAQSQNLLKVGDKAPPLASNKWLVGEPVKSWDAEKIYLIEFGATWCTPCAAAIPELTALADRHKAEVSVVSMFVMENMNGDNPDYVAKVERYINKRTDKIHYTVGVDNREADNEKAWLKRAGLAGVPYIFVLDKEQTVRWIGSDVKSAEEMIDVILKEKSNGLPSQQQASLNVQYDPHKLLLIEGNGGKETDFLFRSLFTRYDGKFRGANMDFIQNFYWLKPDSVFDEYEDKFELIGVPIGELYFIAYSDTVAYGIHGRSPWFEYPDPVKNPYHKTNYGDFWHEPIIEVGNKAPFAWKWKSYYNRYNYSLKVPKGMGTAFFLQSVLRRDLQTYFGYKANIETRSMPYWSLTSPDTSLVLSKNKSKDQSRRYTVTAEETRLVVKNGIVRDIITFLGTTYGYRSYDYGKLPLAEQSAFIDETGITEKIDFSFDKSLSFEEMQKHLKDLGFILEKRNRSMKTVVIRDAPPSVSSK